MSLKEAPNESGGGGAIKMCQKMLDENQLIIDELRDENTKLKAHLAQFKKLSNIPQEESKTILALRAQLERYKEVVRLLQMEVVKLKKKT